MKQDFYVFMMSDTTMEHIHCGYSRDIVKTAIFYKKMPTILKPPGRQNVLVWLESYSAEDLAKARFDEVNMLPKKYKKQLIEMVNPEWTELIPGVNIEL